MCFRSGVMVREEVNDEIQRSISYIKDELQNSTENKVLEGRKKERSFWMHGDGMKQIAHYGSYGKKEKTMNKTSENMTYLIDKKKFFVNIKNCTP